MASKRKQLQQAKRSARTAQDKRQQLEPTGESNYGKKKEYLTGASRRAGQHVFGFEFEAPKPWK